MPCVRHWGASDGQHRDRPPESHSLVGETDNKPAIIIQGDQYHDMASEKGLLSPAGVTAIEGLLQEATLRSHGQVGISQVHGNWGSQEEGTACSKAQISSSSVTLELPIIRSHPRICKSDKSPI